VDESERMRFTQDMMNNFDTGKILISNEDWKHVTFIKIDRPEFFRNFKINYDEKKSINDAIDSPLISLHAKSVNELLFIGQQYDLKYLVLIDDEYSTWYGYLADVYKKESNYEYLTKVYDSSEMEFKKLHVKVFSIDYDKWKSISTN